MRYLWTWTHGEDRTCPQVRFETKSPVISQAKGKNGLFDVVEKIEDNHVF